MSLNPKFFDCNHKDLYCLKCFVDLNEVNCKKNKIRSWNLRFMSPVEPKKLPNYADGLEIPKGRFVISKAKEISFDGINFWIENTKNESF